MYELAPRRPSFRRSLTIAVALPALIATMSLTGEAQAKAQEAPPPPRPWLQAKVEAAKNLSLRKVKANTPAAKKLEKDIRGLIDDMLDWDEMTKRSLGREWKKRTPAEQAEFSKILREMIEASYQSKMRLAAKGKAKKPNEVKITWLEEEVKRGKGRVTAKVQADKTKVILEFSVLWKDGQWGVYDLAIDDVSTVRTYRSQFRKLISDKGFDTLLERMRAKSKEIREGKADLASAMK